MAKEREIKPLKFSVLKDISKRQIDEHHDVLYAGYVNKLKEIEKKMESAAAEDANATFSLVRELKLEETFAKNGIKLHEGYFENLGGDGKAAGKIVEMIKRDFSSFEAWEKEFKALGLCARGWVVLAYDWDDMKLCNYLCDFHSHGGVWGATPILIMDMYEHAYFLDYGTAKKKYIEAFMKNIDWAQVNSKADKIRIV